MDIINLFVESVKESFDLKRCVQKSLTEDAKDSSSFLNDSGIGGQDNVKSDAYSVIFSLKYFAACKRIASFSILFNF